MKIIHTADIHLRQYGDERWEALQKIIALGKKERVELLLISGDLFDRAGDAEALRPHIRALLSATGFRVCLIPGNHDKDSYAGGIYFGEDTVLLTDPHTPYEYKDVQIWGIPFEPAEREKILYRLHTLAPRLTPDKKQIVLYHGELLDVFFSRSDFGDEGDERYMPVKLSYFDDLRIDYVLAGHFHKRFDVRKLAQGGYFVYPGSPCSITKKEIGQRRINLFELGKPPQELFLDTPYFAEVIVCCDPFTDKNPLEQIKERLQELPAHAQALLTVTGFINGEALGMTEEEFARRAKKIAAGRCAEEEYEFRDIRQILEDDLFKDFLKKLEQASYAAEKKQQMRETAIRGMMEARR
jgi:DNA repair exonuclease SbcCD nuclease subunit